MMYCAQSTSTIIAIVTYTKGKCDFVTEPASAKSLRIGFTKPGRRGKSPIKRVATVPTSGYAADPPGRDAIEEINRWIAAFVGNCDSSAASCHGSTFNLASAERTLR